MPIASSDADGALTLRPQLLQQTAGLRQPDAIEFCGSADNNFRALA